MSFLCLAFLALQDRKMIEDVEPLRGTDPLLGGIARAIRIAADPKVTDASVAGVSGAAFLAAVCSNNCSCRDYRELFPRLRAGVAALGVTMEFLEWADASAWTRIKASIDDGVPVVAWNALGDEQDAVVVGYDEPKDELVALSAEKRATGKLSTWKEGGILAFLVRRGRKEVDRAKVDREAIRAAVALAHRAPLEGG